MTDFMVEYPIDNQEVGGRMRYPMRARKHVGQDKDIILKYYLVLYFNGTFKTKVSVANS